MIHNGWACIYVIAFLIVLPILVAIFAAGRNDPWMKD